MAELDKGYASYHQTLKKRLGLKDIHIAEGHMRGSDPSWVHVRPEDIPHQAGMTDLVLVLDGATLTGAVRPEWIDEMISAWKDELEQQQTEHGDPRKFTRDVISQYLLLN